MMPRTLCAIPVQREYRSKIHTCMNVSRKAYIYVSLGVHFTPTRGVWDWVFVCAVKPSQSTAPPALGVFQSFRGGRLTLAWPRSDPQHCDLRSTPADYAVVMATIRPYSRFSFQSKFVNTFRCLNRCISFRVPLRSTPPPPSPTWRGHLPV